MKLSASRWMPLFAIFVLGILGTSIFFISQNKQAESPLPTLVASFTPQTLVDIIQPTTIIDAIETIETVVATVAVVTNDSVTAINPNPTIIPSDVTMATQGIATTPPIIVQNVNEVLAPNEPIPNAVVLSLADNTSETDRQAYIAQLESLGATVTIIDALNTIVITGVLEETLPASIVVASTEPDYYASAQLDDPLANEQWALGTLNAENTWASLPPDAPQVIIAIIDSGIENTHPDLEGRIIMERDFVEGDVVAQDDFGHGTGVAGIIAANHNLLGIAGVAPNAVLMDLRVLNAQGLGRYSDVANAIVFAADNGAQFINLSLGGSNDSAILRNAIDYARSKGIIIVASAGNTGNQILFPANYAPVIAVGALDFSGEQSSFSAQGADVYAPGGDILTTHKNGDYVRQSGTSFASPYVTGALALASVTGQTIVLDGSPLSLAFVATTPTDIPTDVVIQTPLPLARTGFASLSGWLSVNYGDSDNPLEESRIIVVLGADDGTRYEIIGALGQFQPFHNKRVQVSGQFAQVSALSNETFGAIGAVTVESITPLATEAQSQLGSKPYINLLCRFPDVASGLRENSFFTDLFANAYPGIDHYWRQVSYDQLNIAGTGIIAGWVTLPKNRSQYFNGSSANLRLLAQDCVNTVNNVYPSTNFTQYFGINMFFNGDLDCCAWGGSEYVTADGVNAYKPMTWLPIWSHSHHTIIHEMGHAFGLPHSSGTASNPPSGLNIYVSNWDVMSGWGTSVVSSPVTDYNPLATGTIGYHVNLLGWIASNRRVTVNTGTAQTITLERLVNPISGTHPLLAIVPINGSASEFYTVEVRDTAGGYDQNIPLKSVVIHRVLLGRTGNTGPALVVDDNDTGDTSLDVNDNGAQWIVGETYTDSTANISIQVTASDATSFTVIIGNNAPTAPSQISNLVVTPTNLLTGTRTNTHTSVSLAWANPATNESGVRVELWNGSAFAPLITLPANSISYTHTGLTCDTTYQYRLTSFNGSGDSTTAKPEITVQTLFCPPIHDNTNSPTVISTLPYTNPQPQQDIFGATRPATDPVLPVSCGVSIYSNSVWYRYQALSGRPLMIHTLTSTYDTVLAIYSGATTPTTFVACNDNTGDTTSQVSFNPVANTVYWILVANKNTPLTTNANLQISIDVSAIYPPTLSLPADFANSITATPSLTWVAQVGTSGYDVQIDTTNTFVNAPTYRVTGVSFLVPYALPYTTYYWRVRSVYGTDTSAYSVARQITITAAPVAPIRNLFTTKNPTLSWVQVSYATQYEIQISRNSVFTDIVYSLTTPDSTTLSTTTTDLFDGLYFVRVRARQANGTWSIYSPVDNFLINVES